LHLIANWLTIGGVYLLGVWRHWWPQHNDVLWVIATLTIAATLLGASVSLLRHGLSKSWREIATAAGVVVIACLSAWGYSRHIPYFSGVCGIITVLAWIVAPVSAFGLVVTGFSRYSPDNVVTVWKIEPDDTPRHFM
jgi:hypothetical protein